MVGGIFTPRVRVGAAAGEILAGSLKWFDELRLPVPPAARAEIKASPNSMLLLALDGKFKGYAGLADALRPEAAGIVAELEAMGIEVAAIERPLIEGKD